MINFSQSVFPAPRHLVHVFPGFGMGGSQSRFLQLVKAGALCYRHTVLALNGETDAARHIPAGGLVEVRVPEVEKSSGLKSWMHCRSLLRELRPDTLVTYNWGAMDWCIANRFVPLAPHVHIEDGFGPEEKDRQLERRVWTRRMILTSGQSTIVVPSRRLEGVALGVWKIPRPALRYIPNGIDCGRFGCQRDYDRHPLVIGTVATLRREKNLERLIGLFDRFAASAGGEAELVIVGDGPERPRLEAAASHSPWRSRISFTGATASPEQALARFDIFALTSDTEQMPLSVLEAMASGLPIVSFAVGDVPQMVACENHPFATIAPSDDGSFVAKLAELAGSSSLRRRLGEANRLWARARYDQRLMLESYAKVFG